MSTTQFKKIHSNVDVYEFASNMLGSVKIQEEPAQKFTHPNGYQPLYGVYTNNLHFLQKRYSKELEGKEALKKLVPFVDVAQLMFPEKKVNYRFWQAHLKKVGVALLYCNHHLTPDELKNTLLKVYTRNVLIPQNVRINYLRLGIQLDEIVEHCLYAHIDKKLIKEEIKVLFNPEMKLTGKERKSAAAKIIRA